VQEKPFSGDLFGLPQVDVRTQTRRAKPHDFPLTRQATGHTPEKGFPAPWDLRGKRNFSRKLLDIFLSTIGEDV